MFGLGIGVSSTYNKKPFNLEDLSGITSWYDADDTATLYQDVGQVTPVTTYGQSVALVLDKSQNGFDLTQVSASSQPTYQMSGGGDVLDFDGADDFLMAGQGHGSVREVHFLVQLPTAFSVFTYQAIIASRTFISTEMSALYVTRGHDGIHRIEARGGTKVVRTGNVIDLMGSRVMLGYSHDGTYLKVFINGTEAASTTQTGDAQSDLPSYIGAQNAQGVAGVYFSGSICRGVETDRTLTNSERTSLAKLWGQSQ